EGHEADAKESCEDRVPLQGVGRRLKGSDRQRGDVGPPGLLERRDQGTVLVAAKAPGYRARLASSNGGSELSESERIRLGVVPPATIARHGRAGVGVQRTD